MPILRIVEGPGAGTDAKVGPGPLTIGREADNDLRIEDVKSSRLHAEIVMDGGVWTLFDRASSNGTWTEAGRVSRLELGDGVQFRIGRTWFRFLADLPVQTVGSVTVAEAFVDPDAVEGLGPRASGSDLFEAKPGTARLARHNAYLVLLHALIERSRSALNRDGLFELLDDAAAEVLEGDRIAVFLPDPHPTGWSLWPPHAVRLRARWGAVPFARTLLATVRQRREPLLCTLKGDLDPTASMVRAGVKSAMAAPLRIGDEVHALLYVDRVKGGSPFVRADLEFLAAVANQLAVTLANQERIAGLTAEVERLTRTEPVRPLMLVGPVLVGVDALLGQAAQTTTPVLICGAVGTGKELCARLVHQRSARTQAPLQVLSCMGMAPDELEVALFGCAAGGMPGLSEDRPGLWELAHEATLLIAGLDALPEPLQARLVQAIDRGEDRRRGDGALRRAEVRVLATCTAGPSALRPDLVQRFAAWTVHLPLLSARPGDLDALTAHFVQEWAVRVGQSAPRIAPDARTVLMRAPWPGNVRQLREVLERGCAVAKEGVVRAEDLPAGLDGSSPAEATPAGIPVMTLAELEKQHIMRVIDHCAGNKKAAAEVLAIDRSTLYAKLKQYGV